MESLEEFEDLNTPILSGTEHRAGQGQGPSRNPAASAQRHREIRGEKGRGRGCLCKLRRGLKQKYSQRAKAGRLKNPREINRIERAYVQETTTKRQERGHLDIYIWPGMCKRKPQKVEGEEALLCFWHLVDAMHPGAGLRDCSL